VVAKIPQPVVAAVTGHALGDGPEPAPCAGFWVAGENVAREGHLTGR
jgi:enoyl-CoA hydratase/carnithine racemase